MGRTKVRSISFIPPPPTVRAESRCFTRTQAVANRLRRRRDHTTAAPTGRGRTLKERHDEFIKKELPATLLDRQDQFSSTDRRVCRRWGLMGDSGYRGISSSTPYGGWCLHLTAGGAFFPQGPLRRSISGLLLRLKPATMRKNIVAASSPPSLRSPARIRDCVALRSFESCDEPLHLRASSTEAPSSLVRENSIAAPAR